MADILLKNAIKTYKKGDVVAVNDLTIECKDGEFVTILGPSGAGKTTTLKMIAGIEEITKGQLFINGEDFTNVPAQKRNVSMVFEGYALYPHMTVGENLAFPLRAPIRSKEKTEEEIIQTVIEWAKKVGLDELLDRKTNQLSGGQRQRVSLARALVRSPEPNVILMDEPLAHLDAKLRSSMRSELKILHKDLGATIIYVTHDYTEAMAMSDKIVVINNGTLMQAGTPKEIYQSPINTFVASVVGDPPMNFISGKIVKNNNLCKFEFYNNQFTVDNKYSDYINKEIILGIRSSDLHVSFKKNNHAPAEIIEVLPTGSKQIMEINISGRSILAKVERDLSFHRGDLIYLSFESGKEIMFDKEGNAIKT